MIALVLLRHKFGELGIACVGGCQVGCGLTESGLSPIGVSVVRSDAQGRISRKLLKATPGGLRGRNAVGPVPAPHMLDALA